jgi:hypothetical protein
MQFIFSNTLSVAVTKHIDLSAIRRETQCWLALLIMQHGTISLWRLAASGASAAQTAVIKTACLLNGQLRTAIINIS